ncbi:hypothetical protein L1987_04970 [Smallanthus sonchifolius]|uniref:Uncharacterized protein n=1 Tax=Smallanthus sonchifolius TaxID=185202 RepID=A0ACB9JU15_9ASTR|nr:hypothetical protein L1987_04970 [Smallanthus sonchifolius]
MDNGPPFYTEGLPKTIPKPEKQRWRSSSSKTYPSSTPSILLAFFSCLAWLYVAGRLWQDAENRTLLSNLLMKNPAQDDHEEADEESSKKAKFFFSTTVQIWNAEFYVKVDKDIHLDLDGLIEYLESLRGQDSLYIGCMKSGEVVSEVGKQWYEPEWWKFGDEKSYFRHAAGSLFILTRNFAQYIYINSASLKTYAHEDTSVGSWMMAIQATYIDDNRLCCTSSTQDKVCSLA